jgi:hypothetical protein
MYEADRDTHVANSWYPLSTKTHQYTTFCIANSKQLHVSAASGIPHRAVSENVKRIFHSCSNAYCKVVYHWITTYYCVLYKQRVCHTLRDAIHEIFKYATGRIDQNQHINSNYYVYILRCQSFDIFKMLCCTAWMWLSVATSSAFTQ